LEGEEQVKTLDWLVTFFFIEAIILCLTASFRLINFQSTITLVIFDALFISLIFQLNGSVLKKISLLAVGNIVGLFWNLIFYYFYLAGYDHFGLAFTAFYTLIYPILNLMWIVPFWSLSLGFLPKQQQAIKQAKH
jgi:hypothetical protein